MKYIVMENHLSYAVLLGDDGRFVKAANLHYEVGQTVTDIIEMKETSVKKVNYKLISGLAAIAACFVLLISTFFNNQTYASVFMVINPEVRIDVNHKNMVIGLEGVNEDGWDLIEGYSYKKKSLEPVMDELVDRAIEMGYLSDGEQITLILDASDQEWITTTGTNLQTHMDEYLTDQISIEVEVSNPEVPKSSVTIQETNVTDTPQSIVIPTTPPDDDFHYGESDYSEISDDEDDFEDDYDNEDNEEHEVIEEKTSDYSEPDDDLEAESSDHDSGNSGYDHDDGSDDGASSYEVSNYEETEPDYGHLEDEDRRDNDEEESSEDYDDDDEEESSEDYDDDNEEEDSDTSDYE